MAPGQTWVCHGFTKWRMIQVSKGLMVKKFYKGKDKYVVREMAKDYTDVEVVWLTDSKDKKCLGGALWTKLITGFVRLDKWMMRALKKRSGRLNTDRLRPRWRRRKKDGWSSFLKVVFIINIWFQVVELKKCVMNNCGELKTLVIVPMAMLWCSA